MKKIILFLSFCFMSLVFTNISYAETSYIYYYGQGCSHCANVDNYMQAVDGYNKLPIEKREVYFDKENAAKMSIDSAKLGLESVGVPFLIINENSEETPLVGDVPIIDYFTPILGEAPKGNKKSIVFILLATLGVVVFSILFIKSPKK